MAKAGVYISVDQRSIDGAMQISIGIQDESGHGHGYRLAGPKYDGRGKTLLRHVLSERDATEVKVYLDKVRE